MTAEPWRTGARAIAVGRGGEDGGRRLELLCRVADRAADSATVAATRRIVEEERAAAERIARTFDVAMDTALEKLGVAAS